jgi:pimeloyl-ACP methyl ester carboxylesterase
MPILELPQYHLYYEVIGEGEPLIFMHGMGGSIQQIKNTVRPIEGIKLILIDQQGHGQSSMDRRELSFRTLAQDVITIADELDLDQFSIAGISMGAAVSLRVAIEHPLRVKKLCLIRNAWVNKPMSERFEKLFGLMADYLERKDQEGFVNHPLYLQLKAESEQATVSLRNFFSEEPALNYPQKFKIMPKDRPFERWEQVDQLTVPTLVFACHQDPVHPFELGQEITSHLKNGIFHELVSKDINTKAHLDALNHHLTLFLTNRTEPR